MVSWIARVSPDYRKPDGNKSSASFYPELGLKPKHSALFGSLSDFELYKTQFNTYKTEKNKQTAQFDTVKSHLVSHDFIYTLFKFRINTICSKDKSGCI